MAAHAYRLNSAGIDISVGETRTYRLPQMSEGEFIVRARNATVAFADTPTVADPGTGGSAEQPLKQHPQGGPGGGPVLHPELPSELLMELLHGGQLVDSSHETMLTQTPSDGDDTWELRVSLDPTATTTPARYEVTVQYPSMLPILTRRVPLRYLQYGFNENWNDRDYIFATLEGSGLTVQLDQQVATYYKLRDSYTVELSYVSFSNVKIGRPLLNCGSTTVIPPLASPGTRAYVEAALHVGPRNIDQPMQIDVAELWSGDIAPFDVTIRFFPDTLDSLILYPTFDCTLFDRLRVDHPLVAGRVDSVQTTIIDRLQTMGQLLGPAMTPWLLGADYHITDLMYDPASTQPVPFGLGDLVFSYMGLPVEGVSPSNTTGEGTFESFNPPLLNDVRFLRKDSVDTVADADVPYSPRGAGDVAWKPPPVPTPNPPHSLSPATDPGDLAKVDHIVVVMMENRSFDHMLGYLSREGGRSDIEGLEAADITAPTQFNFYNGRYYYPVHLSDPQILDSPHHSHENVKAQLADGHGHFVSDYARIVSDVPDKLQQVMGYYGSELATYARLAEQYAVCDHWFSSHVGPTIPNRFVTLTGDLNRDEYGQPEVDTPNFLTFTPSETPTLFDHLTDRNVSWVYFENRVSLMRAFTRHTFDMTNVRGYLDADNGFEATAGQRNTLGTPGLPSVTFIDPAFGDIPAGTLAADQDNDDAPPSNLQNGQQFIDNIVRTLLDPIRNPAWRETMLLVVYDEHGGFYDHVEPPIVATSLAGQSSGRLGPRVPAFVISPWTPARSVLKDTFEHASIPATILRRFCSPHPPPMGPRVNSAADLRGALSLDQPRGDHHHSPKPVFPTTPPATTLTTQRPFRAPDRSDDFGAFLGGLMLTLGTAPTTAPTKPS
jgi:phospholipase C